MFYAAELFHTSLFASQLDVILKDLSKGLQEIYIHPPTSKESREVANITEIKNPHTPVNGVKEFVCLSV